MSSRISCRNISLAVSSSCLVGLMQRNSRSGVGTHSQGLRKRRCKSHSAVLCPKCAAKTDVRHELHAVTGDSLSVSGAEVCGHAVSMLLRSVGSVQITGHSSALSWLNTDFPVLKAQFTGSGSLIDILFCVSPPLLWRHHLHITVSMAF